MANRVHPVVQHMQAAGPDAAVDGIEGEPERSELTPCHDTMLLAPERSDGRVDRTRSGSTANSAVDSGRVSHRSIVASLACRFDTRLHQLRAGLRPSMLAP